jgi:hypothetical protein
VKPHHHGMDKMRPLSHPARPSRRSSCSARGCSRHRTAVGPVAPLVSALMVSALMVSALMVSVVRWDKDVTK